VLGRNAPGTIGPMAFTLTRDDGLTLSDDRSRLDVDRICTWLATSYWASERDRPTIERSLLHSRPYGVYSPDGVQVALARAVTDDATFAWLADVFVDAAWRGKGVGTWLAGAVIEHLAQLGVLRAVLATRDAHEVYQRVGFYPVRAPSTWLEIDRRPNRPDAE
jgi:GNAT superfamily N-acetyltransferase